MKVITFVDIEKSVFYNVNLEDKLKHKLLEENFVIEEFDLEQLTYADFIEYLEFQEYEKLYIVTKTYNERLHPFKKYIEKNCNTNIETIFLEELNDINKYDCSVCNILKKYKSEILDNFNNNEINVLNGLYSLITGIYPDTYNDYIKHLYIENSFLIEKLDKSIIDNMLINGCIVVNENKNMSNNELPNIFVEYDEFKNILESSFFVKSDTLKEKVRTFFKNGMIETIDGNNIIDYMSELGKYYITRLFVYDDGIYCDVSKNKKISEDLNTSYYNLKLKISEISNSFNELNDNILKIFFILNSLANQLNSKELLVTTPYNKREFKEQYTYNKPFNLLGIQDGNRHLCYALKNDKMYETERDFNFILEAYYKDELENLPEEIGKKVANFKEIIKNAN